MPEPDDEQTQDAVRRLLAEARHDEPVPPDVAARLDTLLGRLVDERATRATPAGDEVEVVSLDARRRRGFRVFLVAAAAAVVVGAVGLSQQLPLAGSDTTSSDESSAAGGSTMEAPAAQPQQESLPEGATLAPTLTLTSGDFDTEVRRAIQVSPLAASSEQQQQQPDAAAPSDADGLEAYDSRLSLSILPAGCPDVEYGAGDLYPATYDGEPAVLVVRPSTSDGTRRALLFGCPSRDVVRTTTVAAP